MTVQPFAFNAFGAPDPSTGPAVEAVGVAELESLRAAAVAEGREAGRAEALAAAGPAVCALQASAAQLAAGAEALAHRLEAEAVELALAIAEKVLAGALAVEPERVLEAVRGALRGIADRSRVTVLVHPEDLELVRAAATEMTAALGGIEHLEVQAERRVGRGGAIVRHPEGDVDATVATKLERVRELLEAAG